MFEATRHIEVFNPNDFPLDVHVIGSGAVGSKILLSLAKLGIKKLHAYDFDEVSPVNIANQAFGLQDIAKKKVTAIADIIRRDVGIEIEANDCRVDNTFKFDGVVFLAIDSMAGRKEIFESLKYRMSVPLMLDVRMGADILYVYTIDPRNPSERDDYSKTLYGDEVATVSYCGSPVSVGSTSGILAEMAVWNLIKFFNKEYAHHEHAESKERDNTISNEVMLCFRPELMISKMYKQV